MEASRPQASLAPMPTLTSGALIRTLTRTLTRPLTRPLTRASCQAWRSRTCMQSALPSWRTYGM